MPVGSAEINHENGSVQKVVMADRSWFIRTVIGFAVTNIGSLVLVGAMMWTKLAVLETQVSGFVSHATIERTEMKADIAALKMEVSAVKTQITTLQTMWQQAQEIQRMQLQRRAIDASKDNGSGGGP